MSIADPRSQPISGDKARTLLRRLRDLNLSTGPIAVRRGFTARLAGCSSLDAPAESGVRYRVRADGSSESVMELAWTEGGLELALVHSALWNEPRELVSARFGASAIPTVARMRVEVTCDRHGRACVKALGARVSPSSTDERQLEHFLRRALRTLLA